jgi:outer membrane lipoprotein LolB
MIHFPFLSLLLRRPSQDMHRTAGALTLALSLLTAGCASIAPPSATTESAQTMPAREYIDAIDLSGRLSLQYEQNGKPQAVHGSFVWAQTGERSALTMLSPLGQTVATIEAVPGAATLVQAGQPLRTASDVDTLTIQTLGWPLPVAGLRNWLQGFAIDADGKPFTAMPQRAAEVTTRDGWRIRYPAWRIDLERYTEQAGNVSIRIVIDNWQAR